MTSTINRTYHPKYLTYTGDGSGRDGYVVFGNGGLHDLRDYKGPQRKSGFDGNKGRAPKQFVAARKEATAFDYVPDGTGRDSYVIFNYGLKANYRSSYREFERGLRADEATPMMDQRHSRKNDPFGIDISSYNNWHSPKVRREQRRVANEQRASVERLSKSPPKNTSRSKFNSPERIDTLNSSSIKKPKHSLISDFAVAELETPQRRTENVEGYFSTRHKSQAISQGTNALINRKNAFEMSRGLNTQPKPGNQHLRKMSVQNEIIRRTKEAEQLGESNQDNLAPVQKKLSVVPKLRAHSTLQYTTPIPVAPRGLTTADPGQLRGQNVRVKRVGNLATLQKEYPGGRANSFNRTMGPE